MEKFVIFDADNRQREWTSEAEHIHLKKFFIDLYIIIMYHATSNSAHERRSRIGTNFSLNITSTVSRKSIGSDRSGKAHRRRRTALIFSARKIAG
jgi:hypothetical protein